MKEKIRKELNARNKIIGINTLAIPVINYSYNKIIGINTLAIPAINYSFNGSIIFNNVKLKKETVFLFGYLVKLWLAESYL